MSDRLTFLRAIRASPDDDTVRLVFADWLDEHDDPLGEFIRVQIELEPIRFRIDNPRAVELHAREDELLRKHRDEWIGDAANFPNPADFGPVFRRGLPDYACLSLDTFLAHGEALFTAFPTLREVALYGLANRCSELTLCPLLAKLDTLEIADWPTEDDAISLSVSPHLDRISRFKLWVGGELYFLRELVKQADANWPRAIDLVQVYGGLASPSRETAAELNYATNCVVAETNALLKRSAVRVIRPFEQRFPVDGDRGRDFYAGRLPDGRPAIAARSFVNWVLVTFTESGDVQEVVVRDSPVRPKQDPQQHTEALFALDSAFEEWVKEELHRSYAVDGMSCPKALLDNSLRLRRLAQAAASQEVEIKQLRARDALNCVTPTTLEIGHNLGPRIPCRRTMCRALDGALP